MSEQPEALRLAEYWESRAKELQTWVDENDYVEFGYRPEGLKREQADQQRTAAELRRLHEEVQAEWRINGMSAERELKWLTEKRELLEALKRIAEIQNVHPAIRDIARAAIAKAEGIKEKNT